MIDFNGIRDKLTTFNTFRKAPLSEPWRNELKKIMQRLEEEQLIDQLLDIKDDKDKS